MSSKTPMVMVSSTFYDLKQVRADLTDFLVDQMGFTPLLSELGTFPVDPDVGTIENCRRRVEQDADILVLIVGGRYGHVDSQTAKSVTNLEYLAARAKGIPIFVFIEKNVLNLLPIWEKNKEADFSSNVDDTRIFEFISQVRDVDKVWTHEFESAQQIISTLRIQFSYLTGEGIQWTLRLRDPEKAKILKTLSGKSLRIALEKPKAWAYELFAQTLADEIEAYSDLRRQHDLGIVFGTGEYVPINNVNGWIQPRFSELSRLAQNLSTLMNETLQEALGPLGEAGNEELIVFVAQNIATIYKEAVEWSLRVSRASVDERLEPVVASLAELSTDMIEKIEAYGPDLLSKIEAALAQPESEKQITITATLELKVSKLEQFDQALKESIEQILGDQ